MIRAVSFGSPVVSENKSLSPMKKLAIANLVGGGLGIASVVAMVQSDINEINATREAGKPLVNIFSAIKNTGIKENLKIFGGYAAFGAVVAGGAYLLYRGIKSLFEKNQ